MSLGVTAAFPKVKLDLEISDSTHQFGVQRRGIKGIGNNVYIIEADVNFQGARIIEMK